MDNLNEAKFLKMTTITETLTDKLTKMMSIVEILISAKDEQSKQISTLIKSAETHKGIIAKLNERIKQLEKSQITTNADTAAVPRAIPLEPIIDKFKKELSAEFYEKLDQQKRANNLVFMNVPETNQGIQTVTKIMEIILPNANVKINNQRIGIHRPGMIKRPRPLRITLPSSYDRFIAIQNCKKLNSIKEFNSISVCKDLTKTEQAIERENYVIRRKLKNENNNLNLN